MIDINQVSLRPIPHGGGSPSTVRNDMTRPGTRPASIRPTLTGGLSWLADCLLCKLIVIRYAVSAHIFDPTLKPHTAFATEKIRGPEHE